VQQTQESRVKTRLEGIEDKLSGSIAFLEAAMRLLDNASRLYALADDEQRRALNQALFEKILVDDE
jgi:hypothetical protein